MIWLNCLYLEERTSDLAELSTMPGIVQNCFLYVEKCASDLAELPAVPVI